MRYLHIVSEDLDCWFPRWNQQNFLFISSAPDILRKQKASWFINLCDRTAVRTADRLVFDRYLLCLPKMQHCFTLL